MNDLKDRIIQAVRNAVELPEDLIENIENIEQIKTYCLQVGVLKRPNGFVVTPF